MPKSRLENARRNMIGALVNKVITLLLPFLTRTAMIYYLGMLYLGLNSLFSSILNILSLAELGFGSAMVFSMYEPIANGDNDTVCALLKLYRRIYRIIGIVVLLIGLAIMPFLPHLISGDLPGDVNLYTLYLIYLLNTTLSYFLYAYKESILTADQRSDISSNILSIISIVTNVCQIILLVTFRNYYLYLLVFPIADIFKNIIISKIVDLRYPYYTCRGDIETWQLDDIRKRVIGLFIYRLCYVFRDCFDSVVLSAFLGLVTLGKYNNYYYIASVVTGFLSVIKTSITASVGNSIVTESEEKNYSDFKKCQLLYMWLSSWCTACLFCLLQPFIKLWAGDQYVFEHGIMVIFCVYFYCYKMGDICAVYRQAAGLWWQDKLRPIIESIVNLTLNIILVKKLGVSGVMLSTIFCLVFINAIWASRVLYKFYFIHYKQKEYVFKLFFYALVACFACLATGFICDLVSLNGVPGLAVKAFICLIIPNIVIVPLIALLSEFKDSIGLLKRLFLRG